MKKIMVFGFVLFDISICLGQIEKSNAEIAMMNDTYKRIYFDKVSDRIDSLSAIEVFIDSGYINVRNLTDTSPIFKMIDYIKYQIAELDSNDLAKKDSTNLDHINLSEQLFFKNAYYVKSGKVIKIENVISVPHLTIEASIYYSEEKPFKIFWGFTKDPYLMVFSFYYFEEKNVSDSNWEDFKAYSPFEHQRAIDLVNHFKMKFLK